MADNAEVEGELGFHVSVLDGQLAAMNNAIGISESTLQEIRNAREVAVGSR